MTNDTTTRDSSKLRWVRDPKSGLVVDGRTEFALHCDLQAARELPDAAPEDRAALAHERYWAGIDREIPGSGLTRDLAYFQKLARHTAHKMEAGQIKIGPKSRLVEDVEYPYADEELPPREAEERLKQVLDRFFAEAITRPDILKDFQIDATKQLVVSCTAGLGKTKQTLERLAALQKWADSIERMKRAREDRHIPFAAPPPGDPQSDLVVWMVAPTVDLAREQLERFKEIGGRGYLIRGRTHNYDPEAKTIEGVPCRRPAAVKALASRGLPIAPHLCVSTTKDPETGETTTRNCPLLAECGYYEQFDSTRRGGIYFLSNEYLFQNIGEDRLPKPHLILIDETIIPQLASLPRGIPVDEVVASAGEFAPMAQGLLDELEKGAMARADDWPNLDREELDRAIAELEPPEPESNPARSADEIVAAIQNYREPAALRLFRRAKKWKPGVEVRDAYVDWDGDTRKLFFQRRREFVRKAPWVILDATADGTLVARLWPGARYERIVAKRNAHVIQVHGLTASKERLTKKITDGENLRRKIGWLLETLPGNGLLVTNKDAEVDVKVPATWRSTHFGDFRGQDWAKDCDVVVVVGRPLPSAPDVERMARALFYDRPDVALTLWSDVTPDGKRAAKAKRVKGRLLDRTGAGRYDEFEVPFNIRQSELQRRYGAPATKAGVRTWRHVDRVVEALRFQICEADVEQAMDRVRAVWTDTAKLVVLINETPLHVPVDELVAWHDLSRGLKVRVAFARLGGFLPSDPGWLAKRFPDLWKSPKAAKEDLLRYRGRTNGPILHKDTYGSLGHLPRLDGAPIWSFRLKGQTGKPRLVKTPHPESVVRAWLADHFPDVIEIRPPRAAAPAP